MAVVRDQFIDSRGVIPCNLISEDLAHGWQHGAVDMLLRVPQISPPYGTGTVNVSFLDSNHGNGDRPLAHYGKIVEKLRVRGQKRLAVDA